MDKKNKLEGTRKFVSYQRYKLNLENGILPINSQILETAPKEEMQDVAELNPHRLTPVYLAVCNTCKRRLSKRWHDRMGDAVQDESKHLHLRHWTEILRKYVSA